MDALPLLKLALVAAAMVVVLLLVAGRVPGFSKAAGGMGGRMPGISDAPGFPSALVAATAAATALSPTGVDPWAAGAVIGAGAAVLSFTALEGIRRIVFHAAAIVGAVVSFIVGLHPVPGCAGPGALGRWFIVLLAVIAAVAGAAGFLIGRPKASPLGYFSAWTVISFLASPLGVPAFTTTQPAAAAGLGIVGAAVFGFAAGWRPGPVIGLASLGIALTAVAVAAFVVPACSALLNGPQAYTLIAFAAVYALVRVAIGWIGH